MKNKLFPVVNILSKSLLALFLVCLLPYNAIKTAKSQSGGSEVFPPYTPNTNLRFEHISLEDGLSQSVVNAIYQDQQGFLWFGTQDGLNRYDGYHFTIYRYDPDDPNSISNNFITAITGDAKGNLWIGTILGGVNRYDPVNEKFTHFRFDSENAANGLGADAIWSLKMDSSGLLWIGSDGGVDVLDPDSGEYVNHFRSDENNPDSLLYNGVTDILEDSDGRMWIATLKGLDYLDRSTGIFSHLVHDPDDPQSLMGLNVAHLFEDRYGSLWMGTAFGLEKLNRETLTFEHFVPDPEDPKSISHASVSAILEDRAGNLWVGTSIGLNLLDRPSGNFTRYFPKNNDPTSLNNSTISSLYEDAEGILWIGTFGGGANKLSRDRNKFPLLQYDLLDPKPLHSFGILEAQDGDLWFAASGEGVIRLDRESGDYTLYQFKLNDPDNSLLNNFVWSVSQDKDGTIWIGSSGGLDALDPQTETFTHYTLNPEDNDDPKSLRGRVVGYTMQDSQGYLWIAMPTGLDRFDIEDGIFTHYKYDPENPNGLSSRNTYYVYEDKDGAIWIGYADSGLSRLNPENGTFTHYQNDPNDPSTISSMSVNIIMEDQTGTLWVGTANGLNKFDPQTESFTTYTTKNGLPNDMIYAILEDDQGYLWISTNLGLSRFDPGNETFENFDYNDGLQSNEFNIYAAAKTRDGEMIFAGINGANIFRPEEIYHNSYTPPLVFTSLTQGGESLPIEQLPDQDVPTIVLHWPHNYFEFEFSALSYAAPLHNQYAYQLENFDNGWIENSSLHFGRYTNLPGGSYTLRIKGSNNDGVWNENGAVLEVRVVPPFWQTWWFVSGVLVLIGGVAFVSYRLRVRSIKNRNRELEELVDVRAHEIEALFEQTKELAIIEERNRLARDLHDSAKQKAFAALAQLGVVRRLIAEKPDTAKAHLEEVENLVYEVIQELSFLIQEMYPLALEEKGLVTVLREYIYEWENRNNIHVLLRVEHQRRLPLQVEQALYRIVQESLANIARHSHATEVQIMLNYNGQTVELAVDDNGIGFETEQKPAGVGLRSMQERAEMIGGQLEIDSTPGSGTHIQISTPIDTSQTPQTSG